MLRLASLIICFLLTVTLPAQEKLFKDLRFDGTMAQTADVAPLKDGTLLCLVTQESSNFPKHRAIAGLLHTSAEGALIAWLNLSEREIPVMYTRFILRNDSVLLEGLSSPDSLWPIGSDVQSVNITTWSVRTDSLFVTPVSVSKIETAFSVHTQQFKALNWLYYPKVGYDAEICRFDSDSGTGYKIHLPGYVMITQLIETGDGGVLVLGTTGLPQSFSSGIYMLRLDQHLNKVWENTCADTASFVFVDACLLTDSSFCLLGKVTLGNNATRYRVVRCNAHGESLWQRLDGVTFTKHSIHSYSVGVHILPLADGGCMIAGYRNTKRDPVHARAFVMSFDISGNIVSEQFAARKNRWIVTTTFIPYGENFLLFCYHTDLQSRGSRVFMSRLDKKGKFLPFEGVAKK